MGEEIPKEGFNFSGKWYKGKKDENGILIPHSHPNARYTIRIKGLDNADPNLNNPEGVPINAIFYGGRDSDTMPPILESLDWNHGVFLGASVESETTAQTIGKEGVRKINPMANLDFIVVPLGKYIDSHRKFGEELKNPPQVFATNYFLRDEEGNYLNDILDKLVWVMWAEGRCHNDYQAIKTPIGYIPKYEDLKNLFKTYLDKIYTREEYDKQFAIRKEKIMEKLNRVKNFYKKEKNIPKWFWNVLERQRKEFLN
jgi:phosphoenolpyruvate carboxykinase (GTP)